MEKVPSMAGRSGSRVVTLRDVAHRCGLSVYPVSRALSGKSGVMDETARHVRAVAAEMGYDSARNHAARRLALRKTRQRSINHVIGLLLPNHLGTVQFFFDLFRGVSQEVSAAGYGLLVMHHFDPVTHRSLPFQWPPSVLRGEVDGLIVQSGLDRQRMQHLRKRTDFGDGPTVTVTSRDPDCMSVLRDERGGARMAMAHLLSQGHRRVLYLRHEAGGYPMDERETGYAEACVAAGVDPATCLLPVHVDQEHAPEAPLAEALRRNREATAVLAMNDPNALAVCYALRAMGMRIPEDISVVGWDDTDPLMDAQGQNLLTSVHFDVADMGRQAARMVIGAIEQTGEIQQEVVMPASLALRYSTAPPRSEVRA